MLSLSAAACAYSLNAPVVSHHSLPSASPARRAALPLRPCERFARIAREAARGAEGYAKLKV